MKKVWQFIKFVMVGVSNTLISEVVYAILVVFRCHYLLASFIGFTVSIFNAYYWNNKYVFREDKEKAKRLLLFFSKMYNCSKTISNTVPFYSPIKETIALT